MVSRPVVRNLCNYKEMNPGIKFKSIGLFYEGIQTKSYWNLIFRKNTNCELRIIRLNLHFWLKLSFW